MSQLASLWGEAKPVVSAYVRATVRNYHDAEDLTQVVISKIAQRFDDYDDSKSFTGWALGFARLIILDYRKKSQRKPLLLDDNAIEELAPALELVSKHIDRRYEALEHCIGQLPMRHQSVLSQRYWQDLSCKQIASELSIKENTISVMLIRIRKALADCVAKRTGDLT